MTFDTICKIFKLCKLDDPRIIPFLKRILPHLIVIARSEAALYYGCDYKTKNTLSQHTIEKFLKKHYNYDTVDVSKIVETWRKEYGTDERASDRDK
jgi:hypothetical protein